MTNLGRLMYFLRMEFVKTNKGIILHQRKYVVEILKKFKIEKCNEVVAPFETNFFNKR